jgi:hypothetical protein
LVVACLVVACLKIFKSFVFEAEKIWVLRKRRTIFSSTFPQHPKIKTKNKNQEQISSFEENFL